jgi:hypothetical protein
LRKMVEIQVRHKSGTNMRTLQKIMSLKSLEINKVAHTYLILPVWTMNLWVRTFFVLFRWSRCIRYIHSCVWKCLDLLAARYSYKEVKEQ